MGSAGDKLAQALDELMREKPLDAIRAVEIAERAGVSKQTFYNHCTDKFALMERLFRIKFEEPCRLMSCMDSHRNCGVIFYHICRENKDFLHNAFFSKDVNNLFGAMQRMLREDYAIRLESQGVVVTEELQFAIDFYAKGVTGFTRRWVENGMEISDEKAADLVYGCMPQVLVPYMK